MRKNNLTYKTVSPLSVLLSRLGVNIPETDSRVILATGKYLGEGFDLPCLDTLFLVFPLPNF
jgi:hypothetical protein